MLWVTVLMTLSLDSQCSTVRLLAVLLSALRPTEGRLSFITWVSLHVRL